tara:strand:+ start:1508 stop:3607 length:2100 start_codon:yes stop_codon:yes gene_type:complete
MAVKPDIDEISDSLSRLKENIIDVRKTSKEMGKSWAQNAQKSKLWTAASRILSGSGLWKLQNRFRAVIDVMAVYHDMQEKGLENSTKQTNVMNKFIKSQNERVKVEEQLGAALKFNSAIEWDKTARGGAGDWKAATGNLEDYLEQNFALYALEKRKGAEHDDAVKSLHQEMRVLKNLSKMEEEKIFGSRDAQDKYNKEIKKRLKLEDEIGKITDAQIKREELLYDEGKRKAAQATHKQMVKDHAVILKMKGDMVHKQSVLEELTGATGTGILGWSKGMIEYDTLADSVKTKVDDLQRIVTTLSHPSTGLETVFDAAVATDPLADFEPKMEFSLGSMMGSIGDTLFGEKKAGEKTRSGGPFGGNLKDITTGIFKNMPKIFGFAGGDDSEEILRINERMDKFAQKMENKKLKFRDNLKKKILPKMAQFLKNALIGFLYFLLFIVAAFVIFKVIQNAWGYIKDAFTKNSGTFQKLFTSIRGNITNVLTSIEDIWKALRTGTMTEFLGYVWDLALNVFAIVWKIAWIAILGVVQIIIGLGKGLWDFMMDSPGMFSVIITTALAAWGLWILLKWAALNVVTTITAILGAIPMAAIMIGLAVGAAVFGAILHLTGGFASGGIIPNRGMQIVGERGPELVKLPRGSRVHSNTDSKRMLSSGHTNNIHVNVQGRVGASDSEIRDIAKKIGAQLGREINRTTSSATRM